jgi:hypothetical protein
MPLCSTRIGRHMILSLKDNANDSNPAWNPLGTAHDLELGLYWFEAAFSMNSVPLSPADGHAAMMT